MRTKTIIALSFIVFLPFPSLIFADECPKAVDIYNRGTLSKDFREKERLFKTALALSCTDNAVLARVHNNLGDTYENTNRLDQAIGEYKKAIELAPSLPTPYISLGDVYAKMGSNDKASEYYKKYWDLAAFKTRSQLTDALSLRSAKRAIVPVPSTELYFGFNESILTQESRTQLEELLAALSGNELRAYTYELAGHTCDIGTDAYNQGLSERRADAVRKWLVANGYPVKHLKTKGFGKKYPVADNTTEEGKKLNRRVDIRTTGIAMIGKRSPGKGAEFFETGQSLINEGRYREATDYFERALDNFRGNQSHDEMRAVLGNLYLAYLALGNMDKAFQCQRDLQNIN